MLIIFQLKKNNNPALPTVTWQEKMSVPVVCVGDALEGDQDTPLQTILLWHKHYLELKAIEEQQMQEEFSSLPLIC